MKLIEKVKQLPKSRLPRIWSHLNTWDFAEEIADMKPRCWDALPVTAKRQLIRETLDYIAGAVDEKELNRYWYVSFMEKMDDIEFDVWWAGRVPGSMNDVQRIDSRIRQKTTVELN